MGMNAMLGPDPMGRTNASYRTGGAAFGGASGRRRQEHPRQAQITRSRRLAKERVPSGSIGVALVGASLFLSFSLWV
jgi:hypothetical protein